MQKQVRLRNTNITYALRKRKGSRTMRLRVAQDGVVMVTAPHFLASADIERFVREKSEWIFAQIARVHRIANQPLVTQSHASYLAHKEEARRLAHERLAYFGALYGISYSGVTIRNQRSRWGSCSKNGNLSFNYKIALLPPHLADYIIVHELCHLKEFNHSQQFWELVASRVPQHKAIRRELHGLARGDV